MGRDTIQLETAVSTISQEYLLEFTSEYDISEDLHPELHGPEERIVDFSEDMDLFNLISAPNPSKVKTGLHPRAAHEVPLLTATASWVIDMVDPNVAIESSGTPFAIEKSLLDFDNENPSPPVTEAATPRAKHDPSFEIPTRNVATMEVQDTHSMKITGSGKSTSSPSMVGLPRGIYQPGYGMTNSCHPDTLDACQDVVDHIVPPMYFSKLRHMPNAEFLSQYNKNLAQQVAMDSQLRLRFEQELTQQVSTLQTQVSGKERIKSAFEEFKKYEDDRVEKRCAEMDARLDALSINFDEELYHADSNHGSSMGISKGMSEGLAHGIEHGKAGRHLEVMEAYDPKANSKYLQALEELKDLKYPIMDQLKGLKDSPMEESLLEEAISDNVSRANKKKRCWVVCRTHGVSFAHQARFDGVPVSVPTVAPQGIEILLADAATQTETSEDDASLRLLRSKSYRPCIT
nr:hypothetical protein [Tanacetum cinerariifolium]